MKKVVGVICKASVALVLLVCLSFGFGASESLFKASAEVYTYAFSSTINGENLLENDLVVVDAYSHIYNDELIEYYYYGWNSETGEKNNEPVVVDPENPQPVYYYKITPNTTGETRYSETDPTGTLPDAGFENNILPSDYNSGIKMSYKFKDEQINLAYYISSFEYKQIYTTQNTPFVEIDTGYVDSLGQAHFNNITEPDADGYYSITINVYETFKYKLVDGGFELIMPVVSAPILVNINVEPKQFKVNKEGETGFISTDKESYTHTDEAVITIQPTEGKLVDELVIKDGNDTILTIYGGMQTGGTYFYPRQEVHENQVSYGNFAFAYYPETFDDDGTETIEEYSSSVPEGENYVVISRTQKLEFNDYISVSVDDEGVFTIKREKMDRDMTISVSCVNYAQFNLYDGEEISAVPYSLVRVGTTEYTQGSIPTKIFVIDFTEPFNFYVELKMGYSFGENVDISGILNNTFSMVVTTGGRTDMVAELDDNCSINITLKNEDGTAFQNAYTKIYITTRDITSPSELTEEERQQGGLDANAGIAMRSKIPSGTMVKVYIQISPYYMMKNIVAINPGGDPVYESGAGYAYHYVNQDGSLKELMVTGHQTLVFELSLLRFTKEVYDGETNIGMLRVSVDNVNSYGDANYTVEFKESISYDAITPSYPFKTGYDFKMMAVNSKEFIVNYSGVFDIPQGDINYHNIVARDVFIAQKVDAFFDPQLKEYLLVYGDDEYVLKFYYDSNEIFIDAPVEVTEPGKFFGGFTYGEENYLNIGDVEPELVPEEALVMPGLYKYTMKEPVSISEDGLVVEAVILNKSYLVSVVYYYLETEGGEPTIIVDENLVEFTTNFSVAGLNAEEYSEPTYPGKYNMVGWKWVDDESVNFVLDDSSDFSNQADYTYEYITGMRLVPVFSAGSVVITFYDGQEVINTATVRYGEKVDVDVLLNTDEGYIVPVMHAYNFLGFYDDMFNGEMVIRYVEDGEPPYEVLCENFSDLFGSINGEYVWKAMENVNLYVRWDAEYLKFNINIVNPDLREETEITTTVGLVTRVNANEVVVGNFIITDTIVVSGFKPQEWHFVKSFILNGELIYSAESDIHGQAFETTASDKLVFDPDAGTITIVASSYITEDLGTLEIDAEIEFDRASYLVSFSGATYNQDGELGKIMNNTDINNVYYRVYYKDRYINYYYNWRLCDEEGNLLTGKAWKNITIPGTSVILTYTSLYGDNGLVIRGDNGVEYAFRDWLDSDKMAYLAHDYAIVGVHNFKSVFSNEYDVTLQYFTYNANTGGYVQNSYEGRFWVYNPGLDVFEMNSVTTHNSYEVFEVNGENYFISAWSVVASATFKEYDSAEASNYYALNEAVDIEYSEASLVLRFYAVYSKVEFSAVSVSGQYVAKVSLPNDVVGNSYNETKVEWIVVTGVKYNEFNGNSYALIDDLDDHFNNQGESYENAVIKSGTFITKDELSGSGKAGSSRVIMVIRRMDADGEFMSGFYSAVDVGQLSSLIQ